MPQATPHIRWFQDIGLTDISLVGGKTASLGELYRLLKDGPVGAPGGFAITASAYRDALSQAKAWDKLRSLLEGLDTGDIALLQERAAAARDVVYAATGNTALVQEISDAYREFKVREGGGRVAVRSSATAEDLPQASFAGQHDSFLHIVGEAELIEACRRCFASIFTERAIVYRVNNGFDHFKVALSVAVTTMVCADTAASGVAFTVDTESGFRDVVFITGAYGLGETVVQGRVDPDEFYVHKPTLKLGYRAVLRHSLGAKSVRLAEKAGRLAEVRTSLRKREQFCIADGDILALAQAAMQVEEHYSELNGQPTPMDIEWAKDGTDGALYILQARPETVASRRSAATLETHRLESHGRELLSGKAVGEKAASGPVRIIRSAAQMAGFRAGEVLVAPATSPDWLPVMKLASAIITDQGGRTCHAAIVARELGVPAVVGTGSATERLSDGQLVTVSCAEGESGRVYEGSAEIKVDRLALDSLPRPTTKVMVNMAQPDLAFRTAMLPADGVGLARMEFIIGQQIGIHPMAAAHPERVRWQDRRAMEIRADGEAPREYFVRRLAEGVGTIAAAFYPRPVTVRLSDFKTNEYAQLLGGSAFEPAEQNPMLGFRGAARYAHPRYADGFALECEALKRVRETMGLTNVKIMVPFCRRTEEAQEVLSAMAGHGLKRGEGGLEVYMMCEIPNNVIQIAAFARLFDGFSIGSNDLTQLVLGVDRDSETVAFDFDERDPGVLEMLRQAIQGARRSRRRIGICGEAPATYPDIAAFVVGLGIDSVSVNPSSLPKTLEIVAQSEKARKT